MPKNFGPNRRFQSMIGVHVDDDGIAAARLFVSITHCRSGVELILPQGVGVEDLFPSFRRTPDRSCVRKSTAGRVSSGDSPFEATIELAESWGRGRMQTPVKSMLLQLPRTGTSTLRRSKHSSLSHALLLGLPCVGYSVGVRCIGLRRGRWEADSTTPRQSAGPAVVRRCNFMHRSDR
jgi:hypothetical protein